MRQFFLRIGTFLICFVLLCLMCAPRIMARADDADEVNMDPFYYLSGYNGEFEKELDKEMFEDSDVNLKNVFVRGGYQVFKYASISGVAITGLICVVVWMTSRDPNKRSEKRRALFKKSLLLVGVFSASWLLSSLFNLLSIFR